MIKKICIFIFVMAISVSGYSQDSHIYSTWDVIEIDTCASAWLIKRFVDKEAVFRFYPKGELIEEGIAFDTPDAEFRRYNNMSAYESILKKYKFNDPALKAIGDLIHQIEINYWRAGENEKADKLNGEIDNILREKKNADEYFNKSFLVFDDIYKKLKK